MNQGEWELLGVLTQFREFSMESSDCYAEMKFYVSGTGSDVGKTNRTTRPSHPGRHKEASGEEPPCPLPNSSPGTSTK